MAYGDIETGEKLSTAHWQVCDAGEYGKFLTADIRDFVIAPVD